MLLKYCAVDKTCNLAVNVQRPSAYNFPLTDESATQAGVESDAEGELPTPVKAKLTLTSRQRTRRRAHRAKEARQAENTLRGVESHKRMFDCVLPDLTESPIGTLRSHDKRPEDAVRVGVAQKVRRAPVDPSH